MNTQETFNEMWACPKCGTVRYISDPNVEQVSCWTCDYSFSKAEWKKYSAPQQINPSSV